MSTYIILNSVSTDSVFIASDQYLC